MTTYRDTSGTSVTGIYFFHLHHLQMHSEIMLKTIAGTTTYVKYFFKLKMSLVLSHTLHMPYGREQSADLLFLLMVGCVVQQVQIRQTLAQLLLRHLFWIVMARWRRRLYFRTWTLALVWELVLYTNLIHTTAQTWVQWGGGQRKVQCYNVEHKTIW